jgi:hypothetical protein
LVLFFNNGYEADIALSRIAVHLQECAKVKSQGEGEEE